ncbi:PAP2 superfamily protein [Arcicella aurantiaca]|uniref:PAP2 superfamily protein n=1 Tax=Arcicella aurantiaca TaxID=591202 RepID=A0A316DG02_9BACT|nr:phosphatase PAP2 family protein [Arcicella aurantiaca]PWK17034.1 PAP2 superfamily protein [Arcicella aurantiaca]
MKKIILATVLSLCTLTSNFAQDHNHDSTFRKAPFKNYILPLVLIGGGLTIDNADFKTKQLKFRNENFMSFHNNLDDLIQFGPHAAVFGLDWIGVKSKHGFNDKLGLMLVGGVITLGTVIILKETTKQWRPDGSANNSFPSGHTANAFFGATILAEEYANESVWYAVGGYTLATATGVFRVLNNRHWASDVLVGAGIGIVSGKIAYAVYPWLKEKIGGKGKNKNISLVPTYDGYAMGGNLRIAF